MGSDQPPKSSYELAMERLRKRDAEEGVEHRPLNDEQKAILSWLIVGCRISSGFADSAASEEPTASRQNMSAQMRATSAPLPITKATMKSKNAKKGNP